jgi:hypothetical protein
VHVPAPRLKHDWAQGAGRWYCTRCRAFTASDELPQARKSQWCCGMHDAVVNDNLGHTILQATFGGEPLTFCGTCGRWMSFRAKALTAPCGPPTHAGKCALSNILVHKRHPDKHRRDTHKHFDEDAQPIDTGHADSHHAQVVARLVKRNQRAHGQPWHLHDSEHSQAAQPSQSASSNSRGSPDDPALADHAEEEDLARRNTAASSSAEAPRSTDSPSDPALEDHSQQAPDAAPEEEEDAFDFGDETTNTRRPTAQPPAAAASSSSAPAVTPALREQIERRRDSAKAKRKSKKPAAVWNITPAPDFADTTAAPGPAAVKRGIAQRREAALAKKAKLRDDPSRGERPNAEEGTCVPAPALAAGTPASSADGAIGSIGRSQPPDGCTPGGVGVAPSAVFVPSSLPLAEVRRPQPTSSEIARREQAFKTLAESQLRVQSPPVPPQGERDLWAEMLNAEAADDADSVEEAEVPPKPYEAPDAAGAAERLAWCVEEERRLRPATATSPCGAPAAVQLSSIAGNATVDHTASLAQPISAALRTTLHDLLDLHECGLQVAWPDGHDERTARQALAESAQGCANVHPL